MEVKKNPNGMPTEVFKGYQINMLGAGYNCPALLLWGYRDSSSLKRAITRTIKLNPKLIRVSAE